MDTLHSQQGGSNGPGKAESKRSFCQIVESMWACSNCGEHGGMSVFIEHCPGCQHLRCHDCDTWIVTKRQRIERSSGVKSDTKFHHFYPLWNVPKYPFYSNTKRHSGSSSKSNKLHEAPTVQRPTPLLPSKFKANELIGKAPSLNATNTLKSWDLLLEEGLSLATSSFAATPTSTPSPSSTINTTERSDIFDSNSGVDESDTDLDVGNMDRSDDSSDSDTSSDEPSLERTSRIFSRHLTSFLAHDLDLAARLIPRMHSFLFRNSTEHYRRHGSSGSSSGATGNNGESQHATGNSSQMIQYSGEKGKNVLKHNRENDDPDEGGRSSKAKRPRPVPRNQTPLFACHFHKKDPERFGNPQSRWYKYCSGPYSSDLRRIKAHSSMSDMDEGLDSQAPEESSDLLPDCCTQPYIVGSDIDQDQWDRIQDVLSKNGKRSLQKSKTEVEKWNDIWKILFPGASGIPEPTNPWAESTVVAGPVMDSLAEFERFLEAEMNSGVSRDLFRQMQQILEAFKRSVAQDRASQGACQYATFDYFPDPAHHTSQMIESDDIATLAERSSSNSTSTTTMLSNSAPNSVALATQTLQRNALFNELLLPAAPVYLPFQSHFHQPSPQSGTSIESQSFDRSFPLSSIAMQAPSLLESTLITAQNAEDQNDFSLNSGTEYQLNHSADNEMSSIFDFEHELDVMMAHSSEAAMDASEQELELWQYDSEI
ncbi:hypothetical protein IFR05_006469 [Cadophora sp. M221]|nr:hypothetical protein IFR05_006469 [Cadophora sp. M221]